MTRTETPRQLHEPAIGRTARKKEAIIAYAHLPVLHDVLNVPVIHFPAFQQAGKTGTVFYRHAAVLVEQ